MEILIGIFIGIWLVSASVMGYHHLKREFKPFITKEENDC